jgi:hypothetical protein
MCVVLTPLCLKVRHKLLATALKVFLEAEEEKVHKHVLQVGKKLVGAGMCVRVCVCAYST